MVMIARFPHEIVQVEPIFHRVVDFPIVGWPNIGRRLRRLQGSKSRSLEGSKAPRLEDSNTGELRLRDWAGAELHHDSHSNSIRVRVHSATKQKPPIHRSASSY